MKEALVNKGFFQIGDYRIDVGDNTITNSSTSTHIEPKAMQVLYVLACHAGETVSRAELMQAVWGDRIVVEDALTRAISKLRAAFGDNVAKQLIQTVPKKGYRLKAVVKWDDVTKPTTQVSSAFSSSVRKTFTWHRLLVISVCIALLIVGYQYTDSPTLTSNVSTTENASSEENEIVDEAESNRVSIAFLPLQNLTSNTRAEFLAEGIPEEISSVLTRYPQITVKSRYAAYAYAKQGYSLQEIAKRLAVDYLFEGSVRSEGNNFRIVTRLVSADSEQVIWSEAFVYPATRLSLATNEIAKVVLQQVKPDVQIEEMVGRNTHNIDIDAYQYYLTAVYWLMHGKTSDWFALAQAALKKAVAIDERFAAAHGRLAYVYARYDFHDVHMSEEVALSNANEAISRALMLDENEINAYLAQAILATKKKHFQAAEIALERVLSLDEDHVTAMYLYSELELARNDFSRALQFAEKARERDPLSPWVNVNIAMVHYWRGEFDEALQALHIALSVDENYTWAYLWQAKIYNQQGFHEQAIDTMKKCLALDPNSKINSAWLGMLLLEHNDISQANQWLMHTASLYGDSDDARFWQGYMRFSERYSTDSDYNQNILHTLLERLTLLETPLFSLTEMYIETARTKQQKVSTINRLLAGLTIEGIEGVWVNVHNYQRAQSLIELLNDDPSLSAIPLSLKTQLVRQHQALRDLLPEALH